MIEIITPGASAARARVALFDFDGTLSTIRSGWMDVMVPMMVDLLLDLRTGETEAGLRTIVEEFVWRLNGKQTVYQMIELASQIESRGGKPLDPLVYKRMYLDLLWNRIESRVKALESGESAPEAFLVPGSVSLLEALRDRGLRLYLASGTDDAYVQNEAKLLGVAHYFDGVHGAIDDYRNFSKAIVIQRIIAQAGFDGPEFVGFGDGYVEIENIKQIGGCAVGAATAEPECLVVDEWKRQRLAGAGADIIIPNYLEQEELFAALFPVQVRTHAVEV